jgi:putative copper export protein
MQLTGFIAAFLASGAIGFWYVVLREAMRRAGSVAAPERSVYERAASRAAILGLIGAVVGLVRLVFRLPALAARKHMDVATFVTSAPDVQTVLLLMLLTVVGFALATRHARIGWHLAAVGVIGGALQGWLFGTWRQLINPLHELAGGLWIGTLFVLVTAGLATLFGEMQSGRLSPERRGAITSELVHAFSPLALVSAGVLVISGLITAWRHLKRLDALWTTPYGYALIAKLCVVAVVFALGAWNWKRQRPTLGSEQAALAIRRSSVWELSVASIVLVITAVLVSLPAPR